MAATKARVLADRASLETSILAAVGKLKPKTTVCPGVLAEKLLRERGFSLEARDALAIVREVYFALRSAHGLRFLQKGTVIPLSKTRFVGPFRLGKATRH